MRMIWTELKPAHSYGRTPPAVHNLAGPAASVQTFRQMTAQPACNCPAEGYAVHRHCYIYDGCYVMGDDLEWVPSTVVNLGIAETIKPVIQGVIHGRHQGRLPSSSVPAVMIAKAGADNYGHAIAEILPKLVNIGRTGFPAIRLILPSSMTYLSGLILAVLAQFGVAAELDFHPLARLMEAEDIHVFSEVSRHNARKSTTFLELADCLRGLCGATLRRERRLYVSRQAGESRSLLNAAEVEAVFAGAGFDIVYPGALPWQDQIRLFATASHIAGPLGAGMSNIGWAPPGCEVFLIDPGLSDYFFWDFSCLARQNFNWLFAGPLQPYSDEFAQARYAMDAGLLRAALRQAYG